MRYQVDDCLVVVCCSMYKSVEPLTCTYTALDMIICTKEVGM